MACTHVPYSWLNTLHVMSRLALPKVLSKHLENCRTDHKIYHAKLHIPCYIPLDVISIECSL